jgi:hypothetical protein
MDNDSIKLSASPANDNDRAAGVIGGIKSLLCDACGTREAASDGYCHECMVEANAHYDERRDGWEGPRF